MRLVYQERLSLGVGFGNQPDSEPGKKGLFETLTPPGYGVFRRHCPHPDFLRRPLVVAPLAGTLLVLLTSTRELQLVLVVKHEVLAQASLELVGGRHGVLLPLGVLVLSGSSFPELAVARAAGLLFGLGGSLASSLFWPPALFLT